MKEQRQKPNFAQRRLRRLAQSLQRRGLIQAADDAESADTDDAFSDALNARACDLHLADLRAAHGASLWPCIDERMLASGDGDRLAPSAVAAQSHAPSFAALCADGGAA